MQEMLRYTCPTFMSGQLSISLYNAMFNLRVLYCACFKMCGSFELFSGFPKDYAFLSSH